MPLYTVSPSHGEPLELDGVNGLVALGLALDQLGESDALERLACECLPNGTLIAKDLRQGRRYVVQSSIPDVRSAPESAPADEPDGFNSWLVDIDRAESSVIAYQAALAAAQVAVPCDSASVLQLDEKGLRFVAASGPVAAQLVGRYIPSDAGAAGFAVQHRQLMVLHEVGTDAPHFDEIDQAVGYQTNNLCCVPVIKGDTLYGVVEAVNIPTGDAFNKDAMVNLERVAQRLANRLARGGPIEGSLSEPSVVMEVDEEAYADPETLEDLVMEPISVEDLALAMPGAEEEG
ncbi:MAG: GAF domain-containing protein [Deltaproteobacteria bacterium]|nr:MAG: GAF domain-containing protein [Deltaproteobacteria bacterium]